jgi:hypothetical protein
MSILTTLATKENDKMREPKGIVYGSVGVGKTIFGLNACNRFLLNCENGSAYTNKGVTEYLEKWPIMEKYMHAIAYDQHHYETFVVDTIDWLLRRIEEHVSTNDGKDNGLNATLNRCHGGYGNGKQVLQNYVYQSVLPLLDKMVERGIAVILLAHSSRQTLTNSDGISVEKSAPAIHPHLRDIIVEWCDFVGLAKKEPDNRVLFLNETPQYLAKNRYGIDDPVLLDYVEFRTEIDTNFKKIKTNLLKD